MAQHIPSNKYSYNLQDLRARQSSRNVCMFLPFGDGATGKEGDPITATRWDDVLKNAIGVDPINQALVEGFSQNTDNALFTVLPFTMEAATVATAEINLSYEDALLPGVPNPTPSFTEQGSFELVIGENTYTIDSDQYSTIENLADSLVAVITSDDTVTVNKETVADGIKLTITTVSKGETANLTNINLLSLDTKPGNLTINYTPFTGGSESTNLQEKIALYKDVLRNGGFTQFLSPYIDSTHLKQIYQGFNMVWDNQVVNNIQFVPMMHIIAVRASSSDLIAVTEFREEIAKLTLSIVVIPDTSVIDDMRFIGRSNGSIFMKYQPSRIVNSIFLEVQNIAGTLEYFDDTEKDYLLAAGLSVMSKSSSGTPQILRLVSSYKETVDTKPINFLTNVLGAVWVIRGINNENDLLLSSGYLLSPQPSSGNKISPSQIRTQLATFIDTNFVVGDDAVILDSVEVGVVQKDEVSVESTINFTTYEGLTFMMTKFTQILGGTNV